MTEIDVAVIGLGNGGEGIVTGLAGKGLRVVGIEAHLAGGECPNYACVPTKMIRHEALQDSPDWSRVAERIRTEATHGWDDTEIRRNLADTGAEILHGTAERDGHTVTVTLADGGLRVFTAGTVVIGVGSQTVIPEIPGTAGPTPEDEFSFPAPDAPRTPGEPVRLWTHREITTAERLPSSVLLIGGGVIACELGQFLSRFGVKVTLAVRGDRLLKKESDEVSEYLAGVFEKDGVKVLFTTEVTSAEHTESGSVRVRLSNGESLEVERLAAATGRTPRLDLETDDRLRVLDDDGQPQPWLLAVGDVSGKGEFTHAAVVEADIASQVILEGHSVAEQDSVEPLASHAVPRVTFTIPEVAGIGLNERDAKDRAAEEGWDVVSVTKDVSESARGWMDEIPGRITLVADRNSGLLLGASLVCEGAGEVLGALTIAVHQRMTVPELRRVMWAYPTLHRVIGDALGELEL